MNKYKKLYKVDQINLPKKASCEEILKLAEKNLVGDYKKFPTRDVKEWFVPDEPGSEFGTMVRFDSDSKDIVYETISKSTDYANDGLRRDHTISETKIVRYNDQELARKYLKLAQEELDQKFNNELSKEIVSVTEHLNKIYEHDRDRIVNKLKESYAYLSETAIKRNLTKKEISNLADLKVSYNLLGLEFEEIDPNRHIVRYVAESNASTEYEEEEDFKSLCSCLKIDMDIGDKEYKDNNIKVLLSLYEPYGFTATVETNMLLGAFAMGRANLKKID